MSENHRPATGRKTEGRLLGSLNKATTERRPRVPPSSMIPSTVNAWANGSGPTCSPRRRMHAVALRAGQAEGRTVRRSAPPPYRGRATPSEPATHSHALRGSQRVEMRFSRLTFRGRRAGSRRLPCRPPSLELEIVCRVGPTSGMSTIQHLDVKPCVGAGSHRRVHGQSRRWRLAPRR